MLKTFRPKPPIRFELELSTVEAAAALEAIEGVDRISETRCGISTEDVGVAIKRFFLAMTILYAVRDLP